MEGNVPARNVAQSELLDLTHMSDFERAVVENQNRLYEQYERMAQSELERLDHLGDVMLRIATALETLVQKG